MTETPEYGIAMVAAPAEAAAKISRAAVERRLAACAQVTGPVTSVYRWKGQVEEAEEKLVLLKTERSRLAPLRDLLGEMHPYEVPELVFLPIAGGGRDYLAWLSEELGR